VPIDTAIFAEDLIEAEGDLPQVVTVAGTAYPAIVTDITRGETLEVDALYPDRAITVTLRRAVLAIPELGSLLTYDSRTFRVLNIRECVDGVAYDLTCEAAQK
jgi:hypothetical protein